jgi:methionyl aminopeptidase
MTIIIKSEKEIEILREGGKRLASVLQQVAKHVTPGVTAIELDQLAERLIREMGDEPAFLNYKPYGAKKPYPASLCVSVNSEVVHGIPKATTILKEGDVVSLDLGLKHKGMFTDHAVTVPVGKISKEVRELLDTTEASLYVGIAEAIKGNRTGDVGYAVEQFANKKKYGIVRDLAGHGVGKHIHEDPYIPNYGKRGVGEVFKTGMVVAIEPMFNLGGDDLVLLDDGYTYATADGKKSAHFEHTVLITDGEPEILTKWD